MFGVEYRKGVYMLQFLIGRLQTVGMTVQQVINARLQFLIGRLQTYYCFPQKNVQKRLQFLIGRLQT